MVAGHDKKARMAATGGVEGLLSSAPDDTGRNHEAIDRDRRGMLEDHSKLTEANADLFARIAGFEEEIKAKDAEI